MISRGREPLPCGCDPGIPGSPPSVPAVVPAGNCCLTTSGRHRDGAGGRRGAGSRGRPDPACLCSSVENGDVLVAELCQNHVRTLWVTLAGDGNQNPQLMYRVFETPGDVLQGSGEAVRVAGTALGGGPGEGEQLPTRAVPSQLFDFIAQCVKSFLEEIGNPQHRLPLGFVFPFSCRQTGLDKVSPALRCGRLCSPLCRGTTPHPRAFRRRNSSPGPRASNAATWRGRTWCSCCRRPSASRRWALGGGSWRGGLPHAEELMVPRFPGSSTMWMLWPC